MLEPRVSELFNHPLNLIVHQVAPAIAVGCPVIVKPAEDTPLSCKKIIEIFKGENNEFAQAVALNAAAGLIVSGELNDFKEAFNKALKHLK